MPRGIFFQELSAQASEFLHELADPDLVRARSLPPAVAAKLRTEQVRKLEANIATLREKQEQFNRRMEEYVVNLRRLIASLEVASRRDEGRDPSIDAVGPSDAGDAGGACRGTRVCCQHCESERVFEEIRILFARESADSIHRPTECYVDDAGTIKKGVFFCSRCGGETLTIRAY